MLLPTYAHHTARGRAKGGAVVEPADRYSDHVDIDKDGVAHRTLAVFRVELLTRDGSWNSTAETATLTYAVDMIRRREGTLGLGLRCRVTRCGAVEWPVD